MKFSTFGKLTFKLTIAVVLISCMVSIAHSSKKSVKAGTLVIPRIENIKQDYLTQNTARYILENDLVKSDVENNPSRYKILSAHENIQNTMVSGQSIYEKDPKAYYGEAPRAAANPQGYNITPKIYSPEATSRYENKNVYKLDQGPYYGVGEEFKVITNAPKDKVAVPIEMKDLTYTFPDPKNIRALEQTLNNINGREDINKVSLTGKYMKDPVAYYDPTLYEKASKSATIIETINNMKQEMTYEGPVFTEENYSVKTKIQNIKNANKEDVNDLIANNYYYGVNKNQTEAPKHNFENKEEAEASKHELVEVEIVGVSLGSKYYETDKKPVLMEAEEKTLSSNKLESIPKISPSSDRKNEKVEIKKEAEKKVEQKEKVEFKPVKIEEKVAKVEAKTEVKVKEQEKLVEKIIEKTVELKSEKKNLRGVGPIFQGFRLQFGKLPTV